MAAIELVLPRDSWYSSTVTLFVMILIDERDLRCCLSGLALASNNFSSVSPAFESIDQKGFNLPFSNSVSRSPYR